MKRESHEIINLSFPGILSMARKEAGLSQDELSKRVGISKQAVSTYESGSKIPSFETAARIAKTLGISLNYLYSGDTDADSLSIMNEGDIASIIIALCVQTNGEYAIEEDRITIHIDGYSDVAKYLKDYAAMTQMKKKGIISETAFIDWVVVSMEKLRKKRIEQEGENAAEE